MCGSVCTCVILHASLLDFGFDMALRTLPAYRPNVLLVTSIHLTMPSSPIGTSHGSVKPITSVRLELITLIDPLETMHDLVKAEERSVIHYSMKINLSGRNRNCNYNSFSDGCNGWLE